MSLINVGGRMPDGVKVHDFWVDDYEFICASGTALQIHGQRKKLMGKLCLTTSALIMLPYKGMWLKVGEMVIKRLQDAVLGDYADMAEMLENMGVVDLQANYDKLEKVLIVPLTLIDGDAWVTEHQFLFIKGGASVSVPVSGVPYEFQMAARGHEVGDFASAHDFCEHLNSLLLHDYY